MAKERSLGGLAGGGLGLALGGPMGASVGMGLGSMIGDLFGGDDDEMLKYLLEGREYVKNAKPKDLIYDEWNPESYDYQTIQDDPELMGLQKEYLGKLSSLADTGLSDEDALALESAMSEASRAAKGNRAALMTNAQSRGVGGGGLEFALSEIGNQDAFERARQAAFEKAGETARQRAMYQVAYGDTLANQRQQNFSNNAANTDIINRFNTLNTSTANDANRFNLENRNYVTQTNNANKLNWGSAMAGQGQSIAQGVAAKNAADNANSNANLGLAANLGMGMYGMNQQQDMFDRMMKAKYGQGA